MKKILPRGIRNNNPLNIIINPKNNWVGKVFANTDGTFEQFKHIVYGIRAAILLIIKIITYLKRDEQVPAGVYNIVKRYARENEEITRNYTAAVCRGMGIGDDVDLDINDKDTICSLVYEMAKFENGKAIDMLDIRRAYNMALGIRSDGNFDEPDRGSYVADVGGAMIADEDAEETYHLT